MITYLGKMSIDRYVADYGEKKTIRRVFYRRLETGEV